jgi:hypothetical protein
MIENLGLKNSAASLLQVMSRDGDDTTQRTIADTLKECLALGAELWDTPMVEAQAVPQQHIMQRIRDGQAKIHGSVRPPPASASAVVLCCLWTLSAACCDIPADGRDKDAILTARRRALTRARGGTAYQSSQTTDASAAS